MKTVMTRRHTQHGSGRSNAASAPSMRQSPPIPKPHTVTSDSRDWLSLPFTLR